MEIRPPAFFWPPYAQPRAGVEPAAPAALQLPAAVLDLFYLGGDAHPAAELVAVLGCLGGSIMLATRGAFPTLPLEIQQQLRVLEINTRGLFRTVRAQEVWIASLDAVEQSARAKGYNDAVALYGRMHGRLMPRGGQLLIQPLAHDACLTAGRIDVLHGWLMGLAAPLHHARHSDEIHTHCCLPLAPKAAVEQGYGVALLYPFFDPARFEGGDNTPIALRIIHDVLAQLQHDLREQRSDAPLAALSLPVPSRRQLEDELAADGYQIRGDLAVRGGSPQAASRPLAGPAPASLLSRLRRWAGQWAAPSIALPPQATLAAYRELIGQALKAVATPADTAMMQALLGRVYDLPEPPPAGPPPAIVAPPLQPREQPERPAVGAAPATPWWRELARSPQQRSILTSRIDWAPGAAGDGEG